MEPAANCIQGVVDTDAVIGGSALVKICAVGIAIAQGHQRLTLRLHSPQ
jgi:hypothetical protein